MGPKKSDASGKVSKLSLSATTIPNIIGGAATGEPEYQQCVGKFGIDLEICCREPPPAYPVMIPVYVRGRIASSLSQAQSSGGSQTQQQQQQQQQPRSRPHSRVSATPSALANAAAEEQSSTTGKKGTRPRKSSATASQSGIIIGITAAENDTQTVTNTVVQELSTTTTTTTKVSTSPYRTFHLLNDGDYFRPKLLVDLVNNESESIDQITVLYMKDWKLDQRFIDILKRMVPLQEQLHTLNLCYVGLRDQTINGLVELCHLIKSLKSLSLDGNPQAGEYFYRLIEKEDSKILHLSLRYCDIHDTGAERLANALGNISTQNWKLLTLNLSGNRIGDRGAISLATALRYNRTLISLNLSSNLITDKGAFHLALVLRRIVLTPEEIVRRRYLLAERYAETHPDDLRYNTNSPTPSNVSAKSKGNRNDWKRLEPNKKKPNAAKIAQMFSGKGNRPESDDSRPSSRNKNEPKQTRNEGNSGRSSGLGGRASATLNAPSATATRRTTGNPSNTSSKDSDQSRAAAGPARTKKAAAGTSAAAKKNISIVKEEDEDTVGELISLQVQQVDHENPLMENNEAESHDGQIWLRGNFVLLNLNLSRNYLTSDSVKEFLLSIQQQSALTQFNDSFNLSSSGTGTSLIDFSGLCRLELKGMNDISIKSADYRSLETLLNQKNPSIRFQQFKEREAKELHELTLSTSQQIQPTLSDKLANTLEKARAGSSLRMTAQRPASKLKE